MKNNKVQYLLSAAIVCFFILAGCSLQDRFTVNKAEEKYLVIRTNPEEKCLVYGTRPMVTYTVNPNDATQVSINTKIGAFFTTEMDHRSINASSFIIKQGRKHIPGKVAYNGLGVVFTPYRELSPYTKYTATIKKKVRDLMGNHMARDYTWTWTTGADSDIEIPMVVHTVNPDGATDVFINTKIIATFNKVMDASTISLSTVSFTQGGIQIPGKVTYTGLSLIFTPAAGLLPNTLYVGTITTGVKDLAGNSLSNDFVMSWTTGTRRNTSTPYIQYTTPGFSRSVVSHSVLTVAAIFNEPMDPSTITTITYQLRQGTTPVTGSVLYNSQTMTASFIPAKDLTPNTTYTATITTGAANIAGIPLANNEVWSFTTSPLTGPASVDLGSAADYTILAGSTVTNAGNTIVNGDIGLSPGIAVTGFLPGICTGSISVYPDPLVATAKLDLKAAYNDIAGRTGPSAVSLELGGTTLTPGLYNSAPGTFSIKGDLTLDAQGNPDALFIFQAATTLVTAGGSSIILTGGAQAQNIFWKVGSSATIGPDTVFKGNLLALASITVMHGATVDGRVLTQVAAVTLDSNTIKLP
jgi:hypothetical protein